MNKLGITIFHLVEFVFIFLVQNYVFRYSYEPIRIYFYDHFPLRFELSWELLVAFMFDYYGYLTFILLLFLSRFNGYLVIALISFVVMMDYYSWLMSYADCRKIKIAIFIIPTFLGISTLVLLKILFLRLKIALFQLTPGDYGYPKEA